MTTRPPLPPADLLRYVSHNDHSLQSVRMYGESKMHAYADTVLAQVEAYRRATQLCDKHQPSGGSRGQCVICAGEKLQAALSRIDYACGEPNEMECSDYDVHMNEDAVVERVVALSKDAKKWREREERNAKLLAAGFLRRPLRAPRPGDDE